MSLIYSALITFEELSSGFTDLPAVGFWAGGSSENLVWQLSESALSTVAYDDVSDTTLIDGKLARRYVPLITQVSEIAGEFDTDNPVLQAAGCTITVANHSKAIMQIMDQGVTVKGQIIVLSLNTFTGDAFTSSLRIFRGVIDNMSFTETEIVLTCQNYKATKNGNLLTDDDDVFTIGYITSDPDQHLALTNETPNYEILTFSGVSSFLIVGIDDDVGASSYYIWSSVDISAYLTDIIGSWVYILTSGYNSKGEFRKVLGILAVTRADLLTTLKFNFPETGYYYLFSINPYHCFSERMSTLAYEPDMITTCRFYAFNFKYQLTKLAITGTVDDIYRKVEEEILPIPRSLTSTTYWDMTYALGSDGLIEIQPTFLSDEKSALTFTILPCSGLVNVGDSWADPNYATYGKNLMGWQFRAYDSAKMYSRMFELYNYDNTAGLYFDPDGLAVQTSYSLVNTDKIYDRKFDWTNRANSAACMTQKYKSNTNTVMGLQCDVPDLSSSDYDDFTFDGCYLGVLLTSYSQAAIAFLESEAGIKILSREVSGAVKQVAEVKLKQCVDATKGHYAVDSEAAMLSYPYNGESEYAVRTDTRRVYRYTGITTAFGYTPVLTDFEEISWYPVINTLPAQYFSEYSYGAEWQFVRDFLETFPNADEDNPTRFTNYKKLKIDISTIEEYRQLKNIGFFFARGATGSSTYLDMIDVYQIAVMFEHKTDLAGELFI